MDAQLLSPTSFRIDDPLQRIARSALLFGATVIVLLCAVVVVRGVLGAFGAPRAASVLLLIVVAAEMLASLFRFLWLRVYFDAARQTILLVRLGLPAVCVVCVAAALSMTETSGSTLAWVWLLAAGGELAWWLPGIRAVRYRSPVRLAAVPLDFDEPQSAADVEHHDRDEDEALAANIVQQVTRSRTDDGVEVISGVLRAELACGERTHNLHVAFCPPLEYEPEVAAHQLDGPRMNVSVAQCEIFGTRIELRRAAAKTSESATIFFEVQPRAPGSFS